MAYREYAPPSRLRGHVECGWSLSGMAVASSFRVLPDGCVDVYTVSESAPVVKIARPAATYYDLPVGGSSLVGLRLRPGAASALIGGPLGELADETVRAGWASRAAEALSVASTPHQRLAVLEQALTARLADVSSTVDDLVVTAVGVLRSQPQRTTRDLAEMVAISERQLRRRFEMAVGYGPKKFARIARFQRLLDVMRHGRSGAGWADVAARSGYCDQSHMINDCVALSGSTPADLAADMARSASVFSNTAAGAPS